MKKYFKYGERDIGYIYIGYLVKCLLSNNVAMRPFICSVRTLLSLCNNSPADRGCQLEEMLGEDLGRSSHEAVGLAEQLGDLSCKVGCYSKALDAYRAQVREMLIKLIQKPISH